MIEGTESASKSRPTIHISFRVPLENIYIFELSTPGKVGKKIFLKKKKAFLPKGKHLNFDDDDPKIIFLNISQDGGQPSR